jgi:hypothetical protein
MEYISCQKIYKDLPKKLYPPVINTENDYGKQEEGLSEGDYYYPAANHCPATCPSNPSLTTEAYAFFYFN